jgi:hypothetical protein
VGQAAVVPILAGRDINADLITVKVYVYPKNGDRNKDKDEQQTPRYAPTLERQPLRDHGEDK